jgi:hypothetical protein
MNAFYQQPSRRERLVTRATDPPSDGERAQRSLASGGQDDHAFHVGIPTPLPVAPELEE